MMQTTTYNNPVSVRSTRIMSRLNLNRIGDISTNKTIKAMGMSACQGLCITYNLHSKRFCK